MRRTIVAVVGTAALLVVGVLPAGARQAATPESALGHFDSLGLPALDVAVSNAGFEGIPESIEAGRYLVTVTVAADVEFGGGIGFVRPEGVTIEEFSAFLAGPPADDGGSPVAGVEGTPAEGGAEMDMGGLPPFVEDIARNSVVIETEVASGFGKGRIEDRVLDDDLSQR